MHALTTFKNTQKTSETNIHDTDKQTQIYMQEKILFVLISEWFVQFLKG
jgi:hypothetical protein